MSITAAVIVGGGIISAIGLGSKKRGRAARSAKAMYHKYKGQKETDKSMFRILYAMWRNIGLSDSGARSYIRGQVAWSAAFISYAMTKAGFKDFPKSASHSCYAAASRKNRKNKTGKFRLYRIHEYRPKVGDIVCKSRGGVKLTYDNVYCGAISHSDIVVGIQGNTLITIGGNVSNAISITKVPLQNGFISKAGYYAIIRNLH